MGFSKIHIFPFSPRPGTAAWDWRAEMPAPAIVKDRCRQLAGLERESARAFRRQFVGQTAEVLLEDDPRLAPGQAAGLTERYIRVELPCPAGRSGQIVTVMVTALTRTGLAGRLATDRS